MADYPFVYQSGLVPGMLPGDSKPAPALITGIPQPESLSFGDFSPAPGTTLAPADVVHFTVTGVGDARLGVALAVSFAGSLTPEFVFDGSTFTPKYFGGSTYVKAGNVAMVSLSRSGGWPAAPTLSAFSLYNP